MKKFLFNLKLCFIAFALCLVGASNAFADTKTGTIYFGTKEGSTNINGTSVSGNDNLGNKWFITTKETSSFTPNSSYSHIGSNGDPADSVIFKTTLSSVQTIKSMKIKVGGFSKTSGTISLKVGNKEVGKGSFNKGNEVTVESTTESTGKELSIEIDVKAAGVKIYEITYSYDDAGSEQPVKTLSSISVTGTPEAFKVGDSFNRKGMTVTANYSDNTTVDVTDKASFSTPDMTTAGEKTVTVTYDDKTTSYKINVAENTSTSSIANTQETAYTTAEAINLIKAGNDLDTKVYVKGIVSKVDKFDSSKGYITYWLDNNTFEVFKGMNKGGAKFTAKGNIEVGANVIVCGKLALYNSTYEFAEGNELVKYDAPVVVNVAPTFTTQPASPKPYSKGATASNLVVAATGTPAPTFQWYKNTVNSTEGGVAIEGATTTTYKPSTKELGTTYYYCVATNSEGSATSNISAVSVKDAGSINFSGNQTKLFVGDEDSYTIDVVGGGVLSVTSKNPEIATATLEGNKVTIKALAVGSAVIVYNAEDTETYTYSKAQKSYTLNVLNLVRANLDFTFDGKAADITAEKGMYQNGITANYSESPWLKIDATNDYLLIAFNDEPDKLSYTIKNNGFSGGTFDVLESADNKTYTLVKSHTKIEGTQKESVSLKSASRFVKFVYTEKKSGNVGLGAISITKKVAEPEIATEPKATAEEGAAAWTAETYTREVATGKLSTICLPYDAKVDGATVYSLEGKTVKGGKVQSLSFVIAGDTEDESHVLKAGVPYLYKATANTQTFTKTGNTSSKVSPKANLEGFVGTYSDFMLPVGDYFLYSNGGNQEFRKSGDYGDGKSYIIVRAFKCYISSLDDICEVSANAHEASRRLVIGTETDETTGITTLATESTEPANGKYIEDGRVVVVKNGIKYNLNGQRIK